MKLKSFLFSFIILGSFSFNLFAQETNPLTFSISTRSKCQNVLKVLQTFHLFMFSVLC